MVGWQEVLEEDAIAVAQNFTNSNVTDAVVSRSDPGSYCLFLGGNEMYEHLTTEEINEKLQEIGVDLYNNWY